MRGCVRGVREGNERGVRGCERVWERGVRGCERGLRGV